MKPYIYCEPFCGMAAVFYHLLGCKPPISYMGSKAGYASVIADILGLSRHHRPAAVVLGDVGPTVAVHAGLFGASGVTARDVAGMLAYAVRTHPGGGGFLKPDGTGSGGLNYHSQSPAPQVESLPAPRAQTIATIIRSWKDEEPRALWTRLKAAGWPSLMPPKGSRWGQPIVGRWLGPQNIQEVARFLTFTSRSYNGGAREGYCPPSAPASADTIRRGKNGWDADGNPVHNYYGPGHPADIVEALPSVAPPLACYQGTASRLVEQLPERLDGWVVFCDPPYSNTTGYKFGDCPRSEVLRIALDLHRRGATVAISEAVRLDRELGDGWYAVDISHARKGQARTFTKNQGSNKREPQEWVTMNRPPVQVPGQQQGLFGGGR